MSDAEFWKKKIAAYLHDPPSKALDVGRHEARSADLIHHVLSESSNQVKKLRAAVKGADIIASAADRECIDSVDAKVDWGRVVCHPMSGERYRVPAQVSSADSASVENALPTTGKAASAEELQKVYREMWRQLQDKVAEQDCVWDRMPATTRMPDFSIWEHMESVASVSGALPEPCQVIFQIGPVQEFISASRRTQDFWAGSYLVSYLAWQAMKAIVDELGPDAILYPSLRGQPLVDRDLGLNPNKLDIASLPHRFVALMPKEQAKALAQGAEQRLRGEWRKVTNAVRCSLKEWAGYAWHCRLDELWSDQADHIWRVAWATYPWPRPSEDRPSGVDWARHALAEHDCLLPPEPRDEFQRAFDFFCGSPERIGQVQVGTCYSRIQTVAERCLGSVKSSRTVEAAEHQGELCTCCGQREALSALPQNSGGKMETPREAAKRFWADIAGSLQDGDRHCEVKPDGAERLCAVCSVKRFAQREYLERNLSLGTSFPSTSTIAVADFISDLISFLSNKEDKLSSQRETLASAIVALGEVIEKSGLPRTHCLSHLPSLDAQLDLARPPSAEPPEWLNSVKRLLDHDGDIFSREFYASERLKSEFGKTRGEQIHARLTSTVAPGKLQALLTACDDAGIAPPSKYYAVLAFDGDEMGKWLSGDKAPLLRDIIAPEVLETEGFSEAWADVLDLKRLVSPSFHKVISAALGVFALQLAPDIVEEKYPAKLVYAGGDDLLLLAPARKALQIAEDLRFAFTGQGEWGDDGWGDDGWHSDPADASGFVKSKDGRVLCLMGNTASASVGIAFAHHTQPMTRAIHAAHEECKAAKNCYGRNALSVVVLKRGGAPVRAGGQFHDIKRASAPRLVEVIGRAVKLLSDPSFGSLSRSLPATLQQDAGIISALADLPEAQDAEVGRVLDRQIRLPEPPDDTDEEEKKRCKRLRDDKTALRDDLVKLMGYWRELEERRQHEEPGDDRTAEGRPLPAYQEMINWLLVARFLSTGGGDE